MNTLWRLLMAAALVATLTACGSDDDDYIEVPEEEPTTITDAAADNDNFTTLVAALEATGLDETLDDPDGTFTVFAPTDDAFALLGQETIDGLLADTDTLSNILQYHVIVGQEIGSGAAVGAVGTRVEMANGQSVGLSLNGENLMVNLATVTMTDIETDNGVIHVLDTVLMPPAEQGDPMANIVETAVDAGNFTTLVAALQAADLDTVLANEEETFTVFAPTDAAFDMLGEENIQALLNDPQALEAVLTQHVVAGSEISSPAAYAASGTSIETAGGAMIPVQITDGALTVGGATVTMTDIYTSNGVIHVIDSVITGDVDLPTPPMSIVDVASEQGNFTTLIAALEATGLDTTLADLETDFTVFAPTDAAFDALPEGTVDNLLSDTETLSDILLYHLISGSNVMADAAMSVAESPDSKIDMANGDQAALSLSGENLLVNLSTVISPNVMADNGTIHAVDKVMMPPEQMGSPTRNIVETAVDAGNFTTLVDLLQQTGLDATLADESATFTVFAPTDAAFDKIDQATLDSLTTEQLTNVLSQHVIAGMAVDSVNAFELNGTSVNTVADEDVTIEIAGGMLQIQGSNVTTFDIYTNNGVIHVIDTVITETLE